MESQKKEDEEMIIEYQDSSRKRSREKYVYQGVYKAPKKNAASNVSNTQHENVTRTSPGQNRCLNLPNYFKDNNLSIFLVNVNFFASFLFLNCFFIFTPAGITIALLIAVNKKLK